MTPQMQRALFDLSVCFDPDPTVVCRRVLEAIVGVYEGTMAMINLTEAGHMCVREVINLHPALEGITALPLEDTY